MKKLKLRLQVKTIRVLTDLALSRGAGGPGGGNGSKVWQLCSGSCFNCPLTVNSCNACYTWDPSCDYGQTGC